MIISVVGVTRGTERDLGHGVVAGSVTSPSRALAASAAARVVWCSPLAILIFLRRSSRYSFTFAVEIQSLSVL